MSVDHLPRGGFVLPWLALAGVFLGGCFSEGSAPEGSAPSAAELAGPALPAAPPLRAALHPELRSRVSQVPAFVRLPPSDQAWVLERAAARVNDANARELEAVVQQLAEVRQFAVSEREEPLAAPPLPTEEGR